MGPHAEINENKMICIPKTCMYFKYEWPGNFYSRDAGCGSKKTHIA
jgi:hypothetical protein